jgi:hypothetical protein
MIFPGLACNRIDGGSDGCAADDFAEAGERVADGVAESDWPPGALLDSAWLADSDAVGLFDDEPPK